MRKFFCYDAFVFFWGNYLYVPGGKFMPNYEEIILQVVKRMTGVFLVASSAVLALMAI